MHPSTTLPLPRRRLLLSATALLAGVALMGWALPLGAAPAVSGTPHRRLEQRVFMGTRVGIAVVGDEALLAPAIEAAFAEMQRQTVLLDHYSDGSAVAAVNDGAGRQPVPVPPELMRVLLAAQAMAQRSEGAFDVTVGAVGRWHFDPAAPSMPPPDRIVAGLRLVDWRLLTLDERAGTVQLRRPGMRLDTGGVAKLPILQAGLQTLHRHGIHTALVDGGGDVLAMAAPRARPWRVGIRDPRAPQRLAGAVDLSNGIVASSGDYERHFVRDGRRYHHVLDPRTGYPAHGPHGATLVADSVDAVNGLGAAAMVLDTGAGRALLRRSGVDALVGGRDRSLWLTPGMQRRLHSV
jgi:thiamine biosynthesis lipoprotein